MIAKGFTRRAKLFLLALLCGCLCFNGSCKKSSSEGPPEEAEPTTTAKQAEQEKDSEPAVVKAPEASQEPAETNAEEDASSEESAPAEEESKSDQQASAGDSDQTGLAPIDIELPKPMFVGTPQDTAVPNLEKPLGKPRPPFLAPVGTKNVALGKPISASDEEPIIGEIEMITDGDKEAADGSYVELGPFLQHVTVDLGAKHEIYAIVAWHYHKQPRVYYDVVVQVANDPDFIDTKTVFNNDIDNSAGLGVGKDKHFTETAEGKLIDCMPGVQGRYVRLYSKGNTSNDLNHYIEVEVYGKPVE
jgi:hypothetical protein